MKKKVSYKHYLWKAIKFWIGNQIFGLAPVLLIWFIYAFTDGKNGGAELQYLLHQGVALFVNIAIMGSVLVEYLLSGYKASGFAIFAIYIFPILILGFVALEYLLVYLKVTDSNCFDISSMSTIFVVLLSFLYCILAKASIYIKEDTLHEPN